MLNLDQQTVLSACGFSDEKILALEVQQDLIESFTTSYMARFEEHMWARFIGYYLGFQTHYVVSWGRKHGINLRPVALLFEDYCDEHNRNPERIAPTRLDLIYATIEDDLHEDTAKILTLRP